jgi:hypothetical protein
MRRESRKNPETDTDLRYSAKLRELRDFLFEVNWSSYLSSIKDNRWVGGDTWAGERRHDS